ncbi:hypothetical protein OSW16_25100 [Pseudomonas putida]|uniref:dermonecrotic toxin domain-containing protein n=1 Tax=Pseudomonas putida TaxID=303 RepID=UPI00226E060A|nr:DUF6543 domain-containing protein [Pseudomonas putida]WAB97753.1 hypothetical protein OSW16_25100 [Pseudomonas putida]
MLPLERIEFLDHQITALLAQMPSPDRPRLTRQQLQGELAEYWAASDTQGRSRRVRLCDLRRAMMHAELTLRLGDQTLPTPQADALSLCLDLPYAWQRRPQAMATRAQVYRLVLSRSQPHSRAVLPGMFVVITGTDEAAELSPEQPRGPALLCGLTQGIEAYASLADLHLELCERLDDPLQGPPLLRLLVDAERMEHAAKADRLRYEWYADDPVQAQIDILIEAQRLRVNHAWATAQGALAPTAEALREALSLTADVGKQALLDTRYGLLLEKNLPNWLTTAGPQALSHIMQAMQQLVAAGNRIAAPGILTLAQFREQDSLLGWARARVEERLRHDHGLRYAAADIMVHVVHSRQAGPQLNPFNPSIYVTWRGFEQVGGVMVELTRESYPLDELALCNLNWFDYDYWLTARVTHRQDKPLPEALNPAYIKAMIRNLNVGGSYDAYLKTQLIDSPVGGWRLNAHALINRARMRAEVAKARYAGHLGNAQGEQGYRWVRQVLDYPHNALRPPVDTHRITVRQLTIHGHTLQGVLLINAEGSGTGAFVLYTPDAPDRRAWRRLSNARELMRLLRQQPALRAYVASRLPLLSPVRIEKLLNKGRLGPALRILAIEDDLFFAYYMAEVRGWLAVVDARSRTTGEADLQQGTALVWRLLDLISLVLPARVQIPLAMGRMVIETWAGLEAFSEDDINGVLTHTYNALSYANDAGTGAVSAGLMRRMMRGLPTQPPLPLPSRYSITPALEHLRYTIDGVHGEGVFEKSSAFEGLTQYFIQDAHGRYYQVSFDGRRWRVIDPTQPDAYLLQPVKRLANGNWVIDSPVLWYDGLPDLPQLLASCRLQPPLEGEAVGTQAGLCQADDQLYLQTPAGQLPLRAHLLAGHYHLVIPHARQAGVVPWAILCWQDQQWRIRVRQAGRSSDWLALPDAYSPSLGSNRSRR